MKLPKELPIRTYWPLVDELEGRGLDLSYPREVIKAVKRKYINEGADYFINAEEITLFINHPQDGVPYEATLSPNVKKDLKQFFKFRDRVDVYPKIPTDAELVDIFLDSDKYFSMCVALKRKLPKIIHNIRIGNYKFAAIEIAALTSCYNMEVVGLINDYLATHKFFNKKGLSNSGNVIGYWESFLIINNRSYIISNDAYVAVLIYQYKVHYDIASSDAKLVYENYDVLTSPDKKHTIKRGKGKSFLQDCKAVSLMKKELNHTTVEILEFHDLIKYGGYNDRILSIENLNHVSTIFKHKKWLHSFFVALTAYCDNYLNIDDLRERMNEPPKGDTKELVDVRKIKDLDLFLQTVDYFDSIYDTLIANSNNE